MKNQRFKEGSNINIAQTQLPTLLTYGELLKGMGDFETTFQNINRIKYDALYQIVGTLQERLL